MVREFVCICCPVGCRLTVTLDDAGNVLDVTGNTCNRGKEYAVSEVTAPTRMITTTVKTADGICVPVKTEKPVPKEKIFNCMEEIKLHTVSLPIRTGDVVVSDVAGTGINVIATRSFDSSQ